MRRCYVALGGNVGAVEETFDQALRRLDDSPEISVGAVSGVYLTAPVGGHSGGEFRNMAVEVESQHGPLELLNLLQRVEGEFGRQRERRWGPRTLDLDLIFYGAEIIDHPRLRVPHPACWYRRFVLDPLAEIAADVVHPEKRVTVGELRDRLLMRPLRVALAGADEATRNQLMDSVGPQFPDAEFQQCKHEGSREPEREPALLIWLGAGPSGESQAVSFDSLPRVPRLNAAEAGEDRLTFLKDVLQSALGG